MYYFSGRHNQGTAVTPRFLDAVLSFVQEAIAKSEEGLLVIDGAIGLSPDHRRDLRVPVHGKRLSS